MTDTWASFSTKFTERFTDKEERRREYEQILALKIGVTGEPFRTIIERQMTPEMKRAIFQKFGRILEQEITLMEAFEEAGLIEEGIRRSNEQGTKGGEHS